jgi:hypothetical protein
MVGGGEGGDRARERRAGAVGVVGRPPAWDCSQPVVPLATPASPGPRSAANSRCSWLGWVAVSSRWLTSLHGGVTLRPNANTSLASKISLRSLPQPGCRRAQAGQARSRAAAAVAKGPSLTGPARGGVPNGRSGRRASGAARSNKGMELQDVLNPRYVPPAGPKPSQFHLKRRGGPYLCRSPASEQNETDAAHRRPAFYSRSTALRCRLQRTARIRSRPLAVPCRRPPPIAASGWHFPAPIVAAPHRRVRATRWYDHCVEGSLRG